jgi:uncharacterized protein (DUF736 family)
MANEKTNANNVKIGVAWNRTKKNAKGEEYSFLSIAFTGTREADEYEVVLRNKATGDELALSETSCIMVNNMYKKEDKHPDYNLKAFFAPAEGEKKE